MKILHLQKTKPIQDTINDLKEWIKDKELVGLDTEYVPNTYTLLLIQIGDKDTGFVLEPSVELLEALKPILEDESKVFIGHNIKADYKILKANGVILAKVWDTMVMEILLNGGGTDLKYSLDMLSNRYLGVFMDKAVRKTFLKANSPITPEQVQYAANDLLPLHEIRLKQLERLKELDLVYLSNVENRAVLATGDMELNGMKLDKDKLTILIKRIETEKEEAFKALDKIVEEEQRLSKFVPKETQGNLFGHLERKVVVDYNSPAQIVSVLQHLGLSLTSSNENELIKFENNIPFIKQLLVYREKAKALSTYGANLFEFVAEDGRVHTSFWPMVSTGRFSSSKPNLQNIPKEGEYRSIFVAEPGYKIITGDYSGCELRFIAEGSKDPVFIKTFQNGGDLHGEVAMKLFNVPFDKIKDPLTLLRGKTPRDVAKTINFGLAYGMSEYKLAADLMIPVEDARAIIRDYFRAFPRIKTFLDRLGRLAVSRGYIRTFPPTGRIRYFKDYNDPRITEKRKGEIDREGRNAPMQGRR
jgi:DNA polymerase I-like protein with 3'-5' exonuclease and polymerase domains